jgi:hypothetical protein
MHYIWGYYSPPHEMDNGFLEPFAQNMGCGFGINDVEMLRTVYPEKHFFKSFFKYLHAFGSKNRYGFGHLMCYIFLRICLFNYHTQ